MNKLGKLTLAAVASLTMAASVTTLATGGFSLNAGDSTGAFCADITFGQTVGSPSSTTALTTATNINKVCTYTNLKATDFTLTDWTNANYQNKASDGTYYAVKIGGSKAGKFAGSFKVTLADYTVDRAIVYASGWAGDAAPQLGINDAKAQAVTPTAKGGTYEYAAYTFESLKSNELVFNNGAATTNGRVVISKIVLKAYATK